MPNDDDPPRVRVMQASPGRGNPKRRPAAQRSAKEAARSAARRGRGGRPGSGRVREPSLEGLLRRYQRRRRVALRNQIIERCHPVVENMARSLALRLPRTVDSQDLVHAGMWGLMQAIDKYQHDRCDQFTAFMRIRVRGAMLDELRGMDFLTRQQRRRCRQREAAMQRLRQDLLREPSDAELAAELGVTIRDLLRGYGEGHGVLSPADSHGAADELVDFMDRLVDDEIESPSEAIERRELVAKIRANLQPVEWKVLQMHYLEGLTGKEVARRLRLSASRICQIHVRVMDRLKERLASVAV